MKTHEIPNYFVYGEPVRDLEVGFFHVELVSARKTFHLGEVAAHKHPQLAQITFWLEGGGSYFIEDQTWTFSAPAVSFVPSGVVHGFSVSKSSDAIVLSVTEDALKTVFGEINAIRNLTCFVEQTQNNRDWNNLEHIMKMMRLEYDAQSPFVLSAMLHLTGLGLSLIARLNASPERNQNAWVQPLAERLRTAIDAHFRDNWTIAQYVDELRSTPHLLDKAAQASFEKPVKQLILERRLLEAKRLLKFTIRSAEDIASELGFNDPAYFSREFKKQTSMSPGIWRKTVRTT
jgi:AraC family transcriptional regulator, transcriptional activator of pobA